MSDLRDKVMTMELHGALWVPAFDYEEALDRIEELERERSKLLAAIAWLEPPFVTAATPADELRQRVQFCITDSADIRKRMEKDNG